MFVLKSLCAAMYIAALRVDAPETASKNSPLATSIKLLIYNINEKFPNYFQFRIDIDFKERDS